MSSPLPQRLERIACVIDRISDWSGRSVAWLTLAMVLVTAMVVGLRYLLDLGWIALQESVVYLHALVFLIGAAYTLKHDGHVRVDIFYRQMSPRKQAWVDLLGTLFLLLPTCVFVFWMSWAYVAESFAIQETSRESGGLPWVYLLKGVILVMAGLMILQGLAWVLRNLLVLTGHAEAAPEHVTLHGPDHGSRDTRG